MRPRIQARRSRGAVLAEYAVVLLVAIPAIAGMSAGGYAMLENYRTMRKNLVQTGP